MTYWPGTNTPKSQSNAFDYERRPSCMWTKAEEVRAEKLNRRIDKALAEKQVTDFKKYHNHNFVGVRT